MEAYSILKYLETVCPDKAPTSKLTEYELGRIVGQRELIEKLKVKLQIEEVVDTETK